MQNFSRKANLYRNIHSGTARLDADQGTRPELSAEIRVGQFRCYARTVRRILAAQRILFIELFLGAEVRRQNLAIDRSYEVRIDISVNSGIQRILN